MSANLRKKGHYNDIPEGLMPKLPEEGTVVTYEFTDRFFDPAKRKNVPQESVNIAPFSKVRDPKTDKFIDIGLFGSVTANGVPEPHSIQHLAFEPARTGGFHHITIGRSAEGDELFQYLELSSENESNPNRDLGVRPVFRRVDHEKQAERETEELTKRYTAINHAMQLDGKSLEQASLVMGFDISASPGVQRARLAKYAEQSPEDFFARIGDEDAPLRALIQHALNSDVLKVDQETRSLKYSSNGATFATLGGTDANTVMAQALHVLKSDDKGTLAKMLNTLVEKKTRTKTS